MRKKAFLLMVSAVLLLSLTQTAGAWYGLADTKDYAIPMNLGRSYEGRLNTPDDVDWFKYTNTDPYPKSVEIFAMPLPSGPNYRNINYDIDYEYCPAGGSCIPFSAGDTGPGVAEFVLALWLPTGYTVYWKVKPHSRSDYGYDYATAVYTN